MIKVIFLLVIIKIFISPVIAEEISWKCQKKTKWYHSGGKITDNYCTNKNGKQFTGTTIDDLPFKGEIDVSEMEGHESLHITFDFEMKNRELPYIREAILVYTDDEENIFKKRFIENGELVRVEYRDSEFSSCKGKFDSLGNILEGSCYYSDSISVFDHISGKWNDDGDFVEGYIKNGRWYYYFENSKEIDIKKYVDPNGDNYTGYVDKDGQPNNGTWEFANGDKYKGTLDNGYFINGTYTYANGDIGTYTNGNFIEPPVKFTQEQMMDILRIRADVYKYISELEEARREGKIFLPNQREAVTREELDMYLGDPYYYFVDDEDYDPEYDFTR